MAPGRDITLVLKGWTTDPRAVAEELTPTVYRELRKIAAAYLGRERPEHTLQPTALIHEAYLRLVDVESAQIADRNHFYVLAARMTRRILVDAARANQAAKRGFGNKVQLDDNIDIGDGGQLEEIAEGMPVSLATVKRDLAIGEAFPRRALTANA